MRGERTVEVQEETAVPIGETTAAIEAAAGTGTAGEATAGIGDGAEETRGTGDAVRTEETGTDDAEALPAGESRIRGHEEKMGPRRPSTNMLPPVFEKEFHFYSLVSCSYVGTKLLFPGSIFLSFLK